MKRGPKQTPKMLVELHGHPAHRKQPEDVPDGVGLLWAPPPFFDEDQRLQWDYAVAKAPPGLLTETDREVLAIWCVAAVEWAKAVQEVRKLGQVVKTKDGNAIQNPFLPIVNRQALIMLRAGAEMGFSPAARMALGSRAPEFPNGTPGPRRTSSLQRYLDDKPDQLN